MIFMKKINVTKTYLPPIEEYIKYIRGIWKRGYITNDGPLIRELEDKLKKYLGVKHLFLVSNGTLALQLAIKALELRKEIITTPFSFIATSSSIVWENCIPIYADIDPQTLNINPKNIEKKISKNTEAIIATHLFGNPCETEEIEKISRKHKLKVVYDASHCFGVRYKGKSILNYGDVSILSLHATKLFHTIEGGAIITNNDAVAKKIYFMRNFGLNGPEKFYGLGINAKMSEFNAAMGLCNLPKVKNLISYRRKISKLYDRLLIDKNSVIKKPRIKNIENHNFSYYPIIFPSQDKMLKIKKLLEQKDFYPRRYFYPSLNTLDFLNKKSMPITEDIANRIICLPLGYHVTEKNVKTIVQIIKENL